MHLSKVKEIWKSDFFKNSITLIGGSSIAQIIPIIVTPILSRIYSPADYGKIGLFTSISTLIGLISTLQYSNAFLLPKHDEDFYSLVKLSLTNVLKISLATLILLLIFSALIIKILNAESIKNELILLPLSILMIGVSSTLSAFATRIKAFKVIAFNRMAAAIMNFIISLSFGLIFRNWIGLLLGYLTNQFVNSLVLIFSMLRTTPRSVVKLILFAKTEKVRQEYKNFPKYSLPTDFLNNFTYQMPVFILNKFAGANVVGMYNICNRILALPISFIATSISEVFKQKASETFLSSGSCRNLYVKTRRTLLLLSIVPFLILFIWAPDLFSFFLGSKWREAGEYARILSPLYFLRFINSPLSFIIYLYRQLKLDLAMTIYLNVTNLIILISTLYFFPINSSLLCFSINYSLVYIFMLNYTNKLSKRTV